MKTRNGFVSNSSSSSFVMRGITIKKDVLNSLLKSENPKVFTAINKDNSYVLDEELSKKGINLSLHSKKNAFLDNEEATEMIIGAKISRPEDGEVIEYKDDSARDIFIRSELIKLGLEIRKDEPLSYFFQYQSCEA